MTNLTLPPEPRTALDLRLLPMFAGLSEAKLEAVFRAAISHIEAGAKDRFSLASHFQQRLGVVWSGHYRLVIELDGEAQVTLLSLRPGHLISLGLHTLSQVAANGIKVVTDQAGVIILFPAGALLELELPSDGPANQITTALSQTVLSLAERLCEFHTRDTRQRLLLELLRLSQGQRTPDGRTLVRPAPTQAVLSSLVGTSREAVARQLRELSNEGLIQYRRGEVELRSLERIRLICKPIALLE